MSRSAQKAGETQQHQEGSFRYAEKRRTGTCHFSDRVARAALEVYRRVVPPSHREEQKAECVAAILAHFPSPQERGEQTRIGTLRVVGLGVGTKFLPDSTIREEERLSNNHADRFVAKSAISGSCTINGRVDDKDDESKEFEASTTHVRYGERVRDCHAEVLARRAFRWQLMNEIQTDLAATRKREGGSPVEQEDKDDKIDKQPYIPILQRKLSNDTDESTIQYGLKPGVTLHFYSSSAPCGNAALKKFAKMKRETYDNTLGPDMWPSRPHDTINGHAIREGQFALLLKKDNTISAAGQGEAATKLSHNRPKGKAKRWPATESDAWCPPGTTITGTRRGSIHTCSDKLARWNCLGMQGSLLASLLDSPLYATTLTVGRKMTECICRRAVCCRVGGYGERITGKKDSKRAKTEVEEEVWTGSGQESYKLNHPTIMGTSVYIDEDGILDMSGSKLVGQDVRFGSDLCWVYAGSWAEAECINGSTGYCCEHTERQKFDLDGTVSSRISTFIMTELYVNIAELMHGKVDGTSASNAFQQIKSGVLTLSMLRYLKLAVSPEYENEKKSLLGNHRVFCQWVRRQDKPL